MSQKEQILSILKCMHKELLTPQFPSDKTSAWCFYLDKAISRINQEVPDDEWIPIEELEDNVNWRLPKLDYECLVVYLWFNKHPLVTVATPNCDRNWRDIDFYAESMKRDLDVTHWKPLPLPPSK